MKRRNILEISNDEKIRILSLHETEKRKTNLIFEQQPVTTTVTTTPQVTKTNNFGPFPLGDKFEYGKYQSESVKKSISDLKPQINTFMSSNTEYSSFEVIITAGESRVTNPAGFETPGSLALARANEVKKYFEEIFPDLIKSGKLVIKSPSSVSDVVIGSTPYGGKGSGDNKKEELVSKYKKEQFVNFEIKGTGSVTTTGETVTTGSTINKGCNQSLSSSELQGFGDINKDFSKDILISITASEGTFSIKYNTMRMPDVLLFEIDGKTTEIPGNVPLFRGEDANWTRLFLGTALRAKYGGASLPGLISTNYSISVPSVETITDNLDEMKEWGLWTFENVFAGNSPLKNENFMNALKEYDSSNGSRQAKQKLISTLGNTFPWGFLNGEILPEQGKLGPYSVSTQGKPASVKLTNMAPNARTNWEFTVICE